MSIQKVRAYLAQFGMEEKVRELEDSSATVDLAAQALGVIPARIAKTLSFHTPEGCMLIVLAGDAKIDNGKFKHRFGYKARMLSAQEALDMTGHAVGGVCPFALPEGVEVYTDCSLQRFDTVFPACGSSNSAIELTCQQLFTLSGSKEWVDVSKGWQLESDKL
ncbi:MAG: YbaK/EbsC family protein [Eubacteriales bacterium]|jgi:prolyl-tRNA editing enzyme YbaK/EbsC (Cys-tRNA(Pro) deacylase)